MEILPFVAATSTSSDNADGLTSLMEMFVKHQAFLKKPVLQDPLPASHVTNVLSIEAYSMHGSASLWLPLCLTHLNTGMLHPTREIWITFLHPIFVSTPPSKII